ncbi:MAG: UUP1 family membrane protein, partial [Myxococcota bacterium]|nr:UUP1 family membrane protein [Myxococcota bacterium]
MSLAVRITGALLIAFALAVAGFKVRRFDIPLAPTEPLGPWSVELTVSVRGAGQSGSVTALLPANEEGQRIFDEQPVLDRLDFEDRRFGGNRVGVWSGWLEDVHEVAYRFRVQLREVAIDWAPADAPELGRDARRVATRPTPELPSSAPEVKALIKALPLPSREDPQARVRALFAFVSHEIATEPTAGDDALLTLARREGSTIGKERLLATLLRAVGMPARLVHGLALRDAQRPEPAVWVEVRSGDRWLPMSSAEGFFGIRPDTHLVLGRGAQAPVEATGVRAVGHRYRALRQRLRPDEIASLMAPDNPLLSALSLYRLPVGTQTALHVLLLIPIGALITAIFRNGIG